MAARAKLLAHMLLVKAKMQGKKTIIMPAHIDRLVRERAYNTGKINKLGWHAKYALHEGMKETISYIQENCTGVYTGDYYRFMIEP